LGVSDIQLREGRMVLLGSVLVVVALLMTGTNTWG
jgi:hypothetical protein